MSPFPKIIFVKKKIFGRFTGFALPPYAIFIYAKAEDIVYLIKHEWTHFLQAEELWYIGFPFVYLYIWVRVGFRYRNHWMEREARSLGRASSIEVDTRPKFNWTKYKNHE